MHKQDSKKDFNWNQQDVEMSSIQAYKAHKQEGTIAATTLVSKVHKQGASSNSQGVQHNNYRLAKNTKKKELGTAHHNDASSTAI